MRQGWSEDVRNMLHGWIQLLTAYLKSEGWFENISRVPWGCFKGALRKLRGCFNFALGHYRQNGVDSERPFSFSPFS
jgi:hypothetical protein